MKVAHIITGLHVGGAELVLYNLIRITQGRDVEHLVVSLLPEGPVAERIRSLGVDVQCLNMRMGPGVAGTVRDLRRIIRPFQPDVISAWMYHSNLFSLFVGGRTPLVWNIRNALSGTRMKRTSTFVMKFCARRSVRAARIVFNSALSMREHIAAGYAADRCVEIPNGFDLTRFRPDGGARAKFRNANGLGENDLVFGRLARYHEDKDFPTLIAACALTAKEVPNARFVLCGDQVDKSNVELGGLLSRAGIGDRVMLLGRVDNAAAIPGFDVMVSSSKTEAFPNVLGEAMACEVPCIGTDAGDTREILSGCGLVCPTENPQALADTMTNVGRMSSDDRRQMGRKGKHKVEEKYRLETMGERFVALYEDVSNLHSPPS